MNPRPLTLGALAAVVAAVALPTLNMEIERSRRARCLGNLRNIWAAMNLYANDYRGWLPAVSPLVSGSRLKGENGFDRDVVLLLNGGYATGPAIFVCPSDQEDGDPTRPLGDGSSTGHAGVRVARGGPPWVAGGQPGANITWFNISYVYIAGLTMRDPGNFLLLADEHWDSEGDCPAECNHDIDQFDNHGKAGRNVLFLDGSGRWLTSPSLNDAYKPIVDSQATYRTRTVD